MKQKVFIDTGAFYAKYVANDQYHKMALALWKTASDSRYNCVTTNFILSELITLMVYRFGTKNALMAAREIYSSNFIEIISISRDIEINALDWLDRYSDQKFSMTDATSFAVMKAAQIKKAFTFDRHFETAGFEKMSTKHS